MDTKTKKSIKKKRMKNPDDNEDEIFIFDQIVMFKLKGSNSAFAIVSLNKWEYVSKYSWYLGKAGYPLCYQLSKMTLHKFVFAYILGQTSTGELFIDHIDRNKLNNVDDNLRLVTPQQNSFNKTTATNLKGVKKISENNYTASITKDGIKHEIKGIETESEAANCYNLMAEELFGEYASMNKID